MTDFAHVTGLAGRVRLVLAPNTATVLHHTLTGVAARLAGSGRRAGVPDGRLFPDAYGSRALSAGFRDRHGAAMRAEVAAVFTRVLAAWDGGTELDLDLAGARDLRLALAHAQTVSLRLPRWKTTGTGPFSARWGEERTVVWLQDLESHVATAALARDDVPVFLEL
ncbi:DUF2017 family protein [Amycolatopsis kentuckyensis]|uniref:DUF2017 family protein n=1 Tax=Amycolatopsis kentuckyensis TaxID=218823 RepID=UPI00356642B7